VRSRGARRRGMWALPRLRRTASSWNKLAEHKLAEQLFLGWPVRSATRPATVWKKRRAPAPQPPKVSTARGRKRMPTVWHSAVFWTRLRRAAAAAAEPTVLAACCRLDTASGDVTVTSRASGRPPARCRGVRPPGDGTCLATSRATRIVTHTRPWRGGDARRRRAPLRRPLRS
jgi:hypothetical protein